MHRRPRRSQQLLIQCAAATDQQSGDMKTVVQKITPGDVPFPWSEKDPFRLPVSIDRVQKMLITLGEWPAASATSSTRLCAAAVVASSSSSD
jgi:hypothetical protein